jgi:hypothetical protein
MLKIELPVSFLLKNGVQQEVSQHISSDPKRSMRRQFGEWEVH